MLPPFQLRIRKISIIRDCVKANFLVDRTVFDAPLSVLEKLLGIVVGLAPRKLKNWQDNRAITYVGQAPFIDSVSLVISRLVDRPTPSFSGVSHPHRITGSPKFPV